MSDFQLFAPLPRPVEDALRASVRRFGVIVPVVKDQHGRVIDGHHRSRIADELGVEYRVDVVNVADEQEAREMARTLNADRRHLTEEQRKEVVALLAGETVAAGPGGREEVARHSPPAIAAALGVSLDTVQRDIAELTDVGNLTRPAKTLGLDGKVYPTKRPEPKLASESEVSDVPAIASAAEPKKAQEPKPGPKRKPLPTAFRDAAFNAMKAAESVHRLTEDDRWNTHAPKIDSISRDNLRRAAELLSKALDSLIEGES